MELEHYLDVILNHQSNYIQKMLIHFSKDKAKPLSTLMIVLSLDPKKDPFRPTNDNEEILEPGVTYLNIISALFYLTQCIRLDISFPMNLLARYSSTPIRYPWIGIKDIFYYYRGTTDIGLLYPHASRNGSKPPWSSEMLSLLDILTPDIYQTGTWCILKLVMSLLLGIQQ